MKLTIPRLVTRVPLIAIAALTTFTPQLMRSASWDRPTYSSPIAVSINDRLIWVVNPSDDLVSVIRPDTNTRLAKIAVGNEPQSVALTPDNQYAYVANAAAGTVTIIQISDPAWGTFSAAVVGTLVTVSYTHLTLPTS